MKVSELIEKLKLYPQDYEIRVSTVEGDFAIVDFDEHDAAPVVSILTAGDPL